MHMKPPAGWAPWEHYLTGRDVGHELMKQGAARTGVSDTTLSDIAESLDVPGDNIIEFVEGVERCVEDRTAYEALPTWRQKLLGF